MARTDVYLYTNATSPADAVVTSQTDTTSADFPDLVLGDAPEFSFRFTDGTASWPSWAGNGSYTVEWALSESMAGDERPYALQTQATAITGGWSIRLPINTTSLINGVKAYRVSQEFPVVRLWQHIRVKDADGYPVSYALIRTNLRLRTIPDTQLTPDSPLPAGTSAVLVDAGGALVSPTNFFAANVANSYHASSNSTGNTTVTPAATSRLHTEHVTVTGSAGTRIVILDTAGRTAGDVVCLKVDMPSTAGITVQIRNQTSGGTLLASVTTTGTAGTVGVATTYSGSAWLEPWLGAWVD